ncbi:MAG: hypothetical protein AB1695_12565 [Stygiobacter sp.]
MLHIYLDLPEIDSACCEALFEYGTNICSKCKQEAEAICPVCGGSGDLNGATNPNTSECYACAGTGTLDPETAEYYQY